MDTDEKVAVLRRAYRLFNGRHIEDLLDMMTGDVEWPDVARAVTLHGKEAIRRYWEAQFAVSAPHVEPTEFHEVGLDLVAVVDQRVLDLHGRALAAPTLVFHRYTFEGDLVRRMRVFADRDQALSGVHAD